MLLPRSLVLSMLSAIALLYFASRLHAEDAPEAASLLMKLENNDSLRYDWNIHSTSESKGREQGKAFTLANDKTIGMVVTLRGTLRTKADAIPMSMRISDWSMTEKTSVSSQAEQPDKFNTEANELTIDKKHIKMTENGALKIDSDNDVGLEQIAQLREYVKSVESNETRLTLENTGRQTANPAETQATPAMEQLKSSAQGIFPILAGRAVKPGESWEDTVQMPKLGLFQLAKPVVVHSKMIFAKWVEKEGQHYAQLDIVSKWDKNDLRGENEGGLLVEITHVVGIGAGSCLFDPQKGCYIEGTINGTISYRIDGEKDGQASGLDVTGTSLFSFSRKK